MPVTIEKTKHIDELHFEHQSWTRELRFYKDELNLFKKRLEEVSGMYTSKEVTGKLEHFQNQFMVQRENIDILHHDINEHLNGMATEMQQHAGHISSDQLSTNRILQDRFESETKIYNGLKDEFTAFVEKLM